MKYEHQNLDPEMRRKGISGAMGLILDKKTSSLFLLILFISFGDHSYDLGFRGASADSMINKNGTFPCNGTFRGCFSGDNPDDFDTGELLRHYAGGARWLLQKRPPIAYRSLQRGAVCTTAKYANCIGRGGGGRPCNDYNRCKRAVG